VVLTADITAYYPDMIGCKRCYYAIMYIKYARSYAGLRAVMLHPL